MVTLFGSKPSITILWNNRLPEVILVYTVETYFDQSDSLTYLKHIYELLIVKSNSNVRQKPIRMWQWSKRRRQIIWSRRRRIRHRWVALLKINEFIIFIFKTLIGMFKKEIGEGGSTRFHCIKNDSFRLISQPTHLEAIV